MKISASRVLRLFGILGTPLLALLVPRYSLAPSSDVGPMVSLVPFGDKGAHVIAYAAFSFCFFCAIAIPIPYVGFCKRAVRNFWRIYTVLCVSFVLGYVIEIIQPLFGRSREMADLLANSIGAILGVGCALLVCTIVEKIHLPKGRSRETS